MSGNVTTRRGPRETERALLEWIDRERASSAETIRRVLVVVPSQTLRAHLLRRVAHLLGPAVLGVEVRSLWGLAATLVGRAGEAMPGYRELYAVIARRAVAGQPALRDALDEFEDGPGLAVSALKDLASAGLDRHNLRRALDDLEPLGGRRNGVRAIALVRASVEAAKRMRECGAGMPPDLFEAAARALDDRGEGLLGADAVAVHGFADATGRGRMLLERVMEARGAHLFLDAGAPAAGDDDRSVPPLLSGFAARLGVAAPTPEGVPDPPVVELYSASGTVAEVTEAAWRIRACLDDGVAPEDVAVVMRSLEPHALALRRTLRELGIPFSGGEAPAGVDPRARSGRALAELLELRGAMATDHWMDTWGDGPLESARVGSTQRADVLLGLRALGAARVKDVAGLDVEAVLEGHDAYPLPARRGAATIEDDGSGGERVVVMRRKLERPLLERVVRLAARTLSVLGDWRSPAALGDHLAALVRLADGVLGRAGDDAPWRRAVDDLHDTPLPDFEMTRGEFLVMLRPFLSSTASAPLGGRGGGVRVLPLAKARGLTFDRVFLLGLNRGVFPAAGGESTLLDDEARSALRRTLPDLGVASERLQEERHTFDQILLSANRVCLSWQQADDEGRELCRSPFVESLALSRPDLEVAAVPAVEEERLEEAVAGGRRLPLRLALRRAALRRDRAGWRELASHGGNAARAAAAAAVLGQVDPDRTTDDGDAAWRAPSPWNGFVGPVAGRSDARRRELFVTTLEGLARCPWQAFLGRVLRLEPVPDPLDALPDFDALLVGSTVHTALEILVADAGAPHGTSIAESLAAGAVEVARPDDAAIADAVGRAAWRETFSKGIVHTGFRRALARRVRPMLDKAVELSWPDDTATVVGVELRGVVAVRGRELMFRADRVDRGRDGLVLIDYKSGKPVSELHTPAKRYERLVTEIRHGRRLQGPAYARSAGAESGRYVSLKPGIEDDVRTDTCAADDEVVSGAFESAAATLLDAWERGVFLPRLEHAQKEEEPRQCELFCELSAACIRGDSSHRRRLRELANGVHDPASDEALLAAVWSLGEEEDGA